MVISTEHSSHHAWNDTVFKTCDAKLWVVGHSEFLGALLKRIKLMISQSEFKLVS